MAAIDDAPHTKHAARTPRRLRLFIDLPFRYTEEYFETVGKRNALLIVNHRLDLIGGRHN